MYKLNEIVEITVTRKESNFDRACDTAYRYSIIELGVSFDGYSDKVEGFNRLTDIVMVEFKAYRHVNSMGRHEHIYTFHTWVERHSDE